MDTEKNEVCEESIVAQDKKSEYCEGNIASKDDTSNKNNTTVGNYSEIVHKIKVLNSLVICFMLLIVIFFVAENTNIFRSNHVLYVSIDYKNNSGKKFPTVRELNKRLDIGGVLALNFDTVSEARMINDDDPEVATDPQGHVLTFDYIMSYICSRGWIFVQEHDNFYIFRKTKLKFF